MSEASDSKVIQLPVQPKKRSKRSPKKVPWVGGYIRTEKDGRPTYMIQKMVNGRRYHLTTKTHTLRDALDQLDRFKADPDGYAVGVIDPRSIPVDFSDELIDEFRDWSKDVKGNTPLWVGEQKRYLKAWQVVLGVGDLKKVSLARDIQPSLKSDSVATRQKRVAVIKAFYAWLRNAKSVITAAEDPTFGTLAVPQSKPAQYDHVKAFTREDFDKVKEKVGQGIYADAMTVQAGTGWHTTEAIRFARAGVVEVVPPGTPNPTNDVVLVCPETKAGGALKTRVSAEVGEAAIRLRGAGALNRRNYDTAVRKANLDANLPSGTVSGGKFRHSVATWAINTGADPGVVASFLGHKSPRTTKKFYATHAVPAKVPTLV